MAKQAVNVQRGTNIDYVLTAAANVGDVIFIGSVAGIAQTSGAIGDTIVLKVEEVWDVVAKTGEAHNIGDAIYWDAATKSATTTVGSNKKLGTAILAKASAGTVTRVLLNK